jgi:hypothetical protein
LHAGGNLASAKAGFGLLGGGCSVDSLNQKSSSLPQPSLGSGEAGGPVERSSSRRTKIGVTPGWSAKRGTRNWKGLCYHIGSEFL